MDTRYEHLLQPIQIGPLRFRNRIISSPTSIPMLGDNGRITDDAIAYYEQKAAGGCAVVTVGESIVRIRDGRSHPRQIPLDDPDEAPGLARLADAIHAHGAYASIQLSHGGGLCPPAFVGQAIGPSDLVKTRSGTNGHPAPFDSHVRGLTVEEICELAEDYGRAAAFVKRLGFDMCMIHGGHGWLVHQFFSELTNFRTDEFGGSLENRARFALLIIDKIREYTGKNFPIEFRMSGSERCPGGYGIETGVEIAKLLDGKVDLIHVSAGTQEYLYSEVLMHPSVFQKHGENVCFAAEIKKHVKTPVTAVGALSDPDKMEEILASGQADVLALGRGLIADPFIPKKLAAGRGEDVVSCLRCHECMGAMISRDTICCTVNPTIGRERRMQAVRPAALSKKVLIAGGGPGGMTAAIYAAERGHSVTLCEKTDRLGGALHFADGVEIKKNIVRFLAQLEARLNALPVRILYNTEVTDELLDSVKPDVLIAAVGASPVIPPIPGVDRPHVLLGAKVHPGDMTGRDVVLIGGGLIGCELAVELQENGNRCTLLEQLPELAPDAPRFHRISLLEELKKLSAVFTGMRALEITDGAVIGESADGRRVSLPADTVILACGLRSNKDLERFRAKVPRFYTIGDCDRPGKIGNAVTGAVDMVLDMEL